MIKQLIKQIWNERRSNGWLWAELLIVFVVFWYIVDWTYTTAVTYYEPVGFDITDTYLVSLSQKTGKSSSFIPDSLRKESAGEDLLEITNRLRRLPEVEEASISINSRPYTGSNSGFQFMLDTVCEGILRRAVTPGFFRVFRYESADGGGYQPLADALIKGDVVVGSNLLSSHHRENEPLLGKEIRPTYDSTNFRRISGVSRKVRYNDFFSVYGDRFVATLMSDNEIAGNRGDVTWYEVCLRVKPGTSASFPEHLMELSDSQFSVGNLFILKVESFNDIRRNFQLGLVNTVKTRLWLLGFLSVNIFLGIIGTFWFRTQQRRSEMGLRIAVGSSRRGLRLILNGEGLLLLTLAAIPAIIICFTVGYADLTVASALDWGVVRFLMGMTITYFLMMLMIILGIWYPAGQAMRVQPAEVLREE